MKSLDLQLIAGQLYKLGPDEILRWCILPHDQGPILAEAHAGIAGHQYGGRTTVHKVLCDGLRWSTLHNDAKYYAWSYDVYQRVSKPSRQDEMLLLPQVTLKPFDKWVVDFVGPINPPRKRTRARYIITKIDYLT